MAFGYYKSITMDATQAGSADSSNYPLTIALDGNVQAADADLKTVGNSGFVQNANGYDIRPYSDSALTTALTFELVYYQATTGKLEMHVKIPTLSHSVNTVIYLAFGDATISTDGSSTSTWDSNFKLVVHGGDGTTISVADKSQSAQTVTNHGLTASAGEIVGGMTANGSSNADMTPYLVGGKTAFTVSMWGKCTSAGTAAAWGESDASASTFLEDNRWYLRNVHDYNGITSPFVTNSWTKVDFFLGAGGSGVYKNAASYLSDGTTGTIGAGAGGGFTFGSDIAGSGGTQSFFVGVLDEVRVSDIARSTSWITSDYNAQKASSTFIAWGSKVAVAGIAFDAASNSGDQAASGNYTFNRTVAGTNRYLTVDVELLTVTGATVTSVTDDDGGTNVAMSLIGARSTVTGAGRVECWGLVAPVTGTKSIRVILSASIESVATAVSYTGVQQTSPTEAFNSAQATNAGSATDASVVITSASDNCWIHAACVANDTSITANQTTRNNVSGTLGSGANEDNNAAVTPAGTTTMSYTGMGITATWAIAGYAIRPVADANLSTTTFRKTFSSIGTRVGSRQVQGWE